MELLLVSLAAGLAGFVDAVVGGGGLILTPALFAAYPQALPASLFGTNKSASIWGTAFAAWRYKRQVALRLRPLCAGMAAAFAAAFIGAWLLTLSSPALLRKALPWVLLMVFLYTLVKKELGLEHRPRAESERQEAIYFACVGGVVGLYDGYFGPGAGSFFVFALVRFLGYDFLRASAHAKILNFTTNLAALILFSSTGHVWWQITLYLALANVLGSFLGSHLALRHGSGFVRKVFMLVVFVLIGKTVLDAYL